MGYPPKGCRIIVLYQWCLHMILAVQWYQLTCSDEVLCRSNQPALIEIIQAWHLILLEHIVRVYDSIDAQQS